MLTIAHRLNTVLNCDRRSWSWENGKVQKVGVTSPEVSVVWALWWVAFSDNFSSSSDFQVVELDKPEVLAEKPGSAFAIIAAENKTEYKSSKGRHQWILEEEEAVSLVRCAYAGRGCHLRGCGSGPPSRPHPAPALPLPCPRAQNTGRAGVGLLPALLQSTCLLEGLGQALSDE